MKWIFKLKSTCDNQKSLCCNRGSGRRHPMFIVYRDNEIDIEVKSEVAAKLRIAELQRCGFDANYVEDAGACCHV